MKPEDFDAAPEDDLSLSKLTQGQVCCVTHGEPFRSSHGFRKFAESVTRQALKDLREPGDTLPVHPIKLKDLVAERQKTLCCLIAPEFLELAYMSSQRFPPVTCSSCKHEVRQGVKFSKADLCLKCLSLKGNR